MEWMRTLAEDLVTRIHEAGARSARIHERSCVLVDASRYRRLRDTLIPRCAWCGRVGIGGGWAAVEDVPAFLREELERRTTHGICPACFPVRGAVSENTRLAARAGTDTLTAR